MVCLSTLACAGTQRLGNQRRSVRGDPSEFDHSGAEHVHFGVQVGHGFGVAEVG